MKKEGNRNQRKENSMAEELQGLLNRIQTEGIEKAKGGS